MAIAVAELYREQRHARTTNAQHGCTALQLLCSWRGWAGKQVSMVALLFNIFVWLSVCYCVILEHSCAGCGYEKRMSNLSKPAYYNWLQSQQTEAQARRGPNYCEFWRSRGANHVQGDLKLLMNSWMDILLHCCCWGGAIRVKIKPKELLLNLQVLPNLLYHSLMDWSCWVTTVRLCSFDWVTCGNLDHGNNGHCVQSSDARFTSRCAIPLAMFAATPASLYLTSFCIYCRNNANTIVSDHHHKLFPPGGKMQRSKQLRHYEVTPDSTIEIKVITGPVCWCTVNSLILVSSLIFLQDVVQRASSLQHWLLYITFLSTTLVLISLFVSLTPALTCVLMTWCWRLESLWTLTWGQLVFPITLMPLLRAWCLHA